MIEIGIKKHLSDAVNVPVMAGTRGDSLPCVVYSIISCRIEQTINGRDSLESVRIQVDCFDNSYKGVKLLERDVRNVLHNHSGDMGGESCQRVVMQTRLDGFDNTNDIFRSILRFIIYL